MKRRDTMINVLVTFNNNALLGLQKPCVLFQRLIDTRVQRARLQAFVK